MSNSVHLASMAAAASFLRDLNGVEVAVGDVESVRLLKGVLAAADALRAEAETLRKAKAASAARNQNSPAKADGRLLRDFVDSVCAEAPLPEHTPPGVADKLEAYIERRAGMMFGADASAPQAATSAMAEAAVTELRAAREEAECLQIELARAHDWRFNLEAAAREATTMLRSFLRDERPTKEAVQGILRTLREGIEWAP